MQMIIHIFVLMKLVLKNFTKTRKLDPRKSTQVADIPTRMPKDNADIFAEYICRFF